MSKTNIVPEIIEITPEFTLVFPRDAPPFRLNWSADFMVQVLATSDVDIEHAEIYVRP